MTAGLTVALVLTAGTCAAARSPTGWIYGQFTFNAPQLTDDIVGFTKLRLRGPLMRGYSGILLTTTGDANRTFTLAAEVPAGRHALKNIEGEQVKPGGYSDQVIRLTLSLAGQPVIDVPAGGAVDLGVLLVKPGVGKDNPATLVSIAEQSERPLDRIDAQRWAGNGKAVTSNLAAEREHAAILDWIPSPETTEEFLTATLGRVYWRRGGSAWTALDLPTVAHVSAVVWHPDTGQYWFSSDNGTYWRTPDLARPEWTHRHRDDPEQRTRHLGVLPGGRLWTYRQGIPGSVRKRSRTLEARTADGQWQRIGMPRNNPDATDEVRDTPDGPWLLSLDVLRFDSTTQRFLRHRGQPLTRQFRQSSTRWAQLDGRTPDGIDHSPDNAATWTRWGRTPNPKARYGAVDVRVDGMGVLLEPKTTLGVQGRQLLQVSHDHGNSWSARPPLPWNCNRLLPALARGSDIVVQCNLGILVSADDGHSWDLWQRSGSLVDAQ